MTKKIVYDSYKKAYQDPEFMKSDVARPVRLLLEMLKPQYMLLHKAKEGL